MLKLFLPFFLFLKISLEFLLSGLSLNSFHFFHSSLHARLLQSCLTLQPLSMGFSRQEFWNRLPCPSTGDLPNPEIETVGSCIFCTAGRSYTFRATWEALFFISLPPKSDHSPFFMNYHLLYININFFQSILFKDLPMFYFHSWFHTFSYFLPFMVITQLLPDNLQQNYVIFLLPCCCFTLSVKNLIFLENSDIILFQFSLMFSFHTYPIIDEMIIFNTLLSRCVQSNADALYASSYFLSPPLKKEISILENIILHFLSFLSITNVNILNIALLKMGAQCLFG